MTPEAIWSPHTLQLGAVRTLLGRAWEEVFNRPFTAEVEHDLLDMVAGGNAFAVLGRDVEDAPSSLVLVLLPTLSLWPDPTIAAVLGDGDLAQVRGLMDEAVDILRAKGYTRVRTASPPGREAVYQRFGRAYGLSRVRGVMLEWEIK